MDDKNVRKGLFLALFIALFILVGRLFYPFLTVLLWSGLLYVILAPLYDRVTRPRGGKARRPAWRHFWAGAFSIAGVLIIILPLLFIGVSLTRQVGDVAGAIFRAIDQHPEWLDLSSAGTLGGFVERATNGSVDLSSINLRGEILAFFEGSAQRVLSLSGAVLRNLSAFIFALAFMIFTLYFFFVDGGQLIRILIGAIPIDREYTMLFMRTLRDTSRHLVRGYFLVALYQSVAAFAIFSLFGVKGPLVLAVLTGICSFIPMVGTSLVWLPIGLLRVATEGLVPGLALILCAGFFISVADNFIRPFLLSDRLNVHPLLIFFSILGGLELFGFNGLILGPLILLLFFAALELYNRLYGQRGHGEPGGHGEEIHTEGTGSTEDTE